MSIRALRGWAMRRLSVVTVSALLVAGMGVRAVWAGGLYWTDPAGGRIMHTELDGSGGATSVLTGLSTPTGIDIDSASGKLYWIETGGVYSAGLDGSSPGLVIGNGVVHKTSLCVDAASGDGYMTSYSRITQVELDGSAQSEIVSFGGVNNTFYNIAVDATADKLYWTDGGAHRVYRANLDGSNIGSFVDGGTGVYPAGLDVDPAGDSVYWSDYVADAIYRTALSDPSSTSTLVSSVDVWALTVDPLGSDLYWIDSTTSTLWTSKTDGSLATALLTDSSMAWNSRLAADIEADSIPEPSSGFLLVVIALVALLRRSRFD